MLVFSTDRQRGHAPLAEIESSGLQPPFEHPGRADAIHAVLHADDRFDVIEPDRWGTGPVEAVHDPGLVAFLARAWREYQVHHPGTHDVVPDFFALPGLLDGMGAGMTDGTRDGPGDRDAGVGASIHVDHELGRYCFETTTPLTEGTYDAAMSAVDVALSATAAVLGGESVAYGLCRPPGHHAPTGLYGGYCFFNNAAVAAHHAVSTTGSKVAVLDVDYHHGNGTQQIFYRRGDVQYVSLHGDPERAYPYVTGRADETGAGPGRGSNLNLPLAPQADDDVVLGALDRARGAIEQFGAELLVVSLGVDTYEHDPISDLAVTTAGFRRQGSAIGTIDLPTVVVQEGGYDLDSIGRNVRSFLGGLIAPST